MLKEGKRETVTGNRKNNNPAKIRRMQNRDCGFISSFTSTHSHIAFIQRNKYINIKQKTLLNERAVKKNQSHTLIFSCSPFSIAVCPIEILTCWDKRRKKERGSSRENRRGAVVGGGRAQQLPVESSVD